MPICKGTTVRGKPCKLQATLDGFCKTHKNAPIVITEQCHARGRNGQQCKHKTQKGIYCHQHHRQIEHVKIVKSTIPGAKLGLFATKAFERGDNIVPYTGDVTETNDPNFGDDYTLQLKRGLFISARRTNTGAGRYANARLASRGQGENNAQLIKNPRTQLAFVRATKLIPAGTEVTVPYGAAYWASVRRRS